MKIGFVTHQFPGVRGGGIGTYVMQSARALANAGHEVHVFTLTLPRESGQRFRNATDATREKGVHIHEVADLAERVVGQSVPAQLAGAAESGGEGVYRLALGGLLSEAVRDFHRQYHLDVVEGPEYEALALPLMLQPEGDLPVVTHLHLCSAVAREGNLGGKHETRSEKIEDGLIDAMEIASITLADAVCAPTRDIVEQTRRFTPIEREVGIFPHPLAVPEMCQPLPQKQLKGTVLFVGRLEPRKGTELMPVAFNQFLSRNPDARIRLVGPDTQWGGGSGRARMEAGLEETVRPRVEFVGEKTAEEVKREFAACRFSIVPSLFESFAYVAAESLIAGRAVVLSSGIGATEVVGDAGVVFERGSSEALANAMEKLWRDHRLCAELGKKAFSRAQSLLSTEHTVQARVSFYQAAVDSLRKKPRTSVASRLATLDVAHGAPLLEALCSVTATLVGTPDGESNTPGTRLLRIMNEIASASQKAAVMLYGAGRHTARLLVQRYLWESQGHCVVGLMDDHPRFASGGVHLGLPVCSVAEVMKRAEGGERIPPIVLSTESFEEQFWKQTAPLRGLGVKVFRLHG